MPRGSRRYSQSGYYHVVLKAIDTRQLFYDELDRLKFLDSLNKAKEKGGFEVLAYCLMNSHVHLVVKQGEIIGDSIKRITVSYVWHYKRKYKSDGHIFNNRFFSETIEDEDYLLKAIRYTHHNPVKAEMVESPGEYQWSSYNKYIRAYISSEKSYEVNLMKSYFKTVEGFRSFHRRFDEWDMTDRREIMRYKIGKYLEDFGCDLNDKSYGNIKEMHKKICKKYEVGNGDVAFVLGVSAYRLKKAIG